MADFVDWIILARFPILYFSMLLSIPSILLYLAEVCIVARHKQFHKTFYALFAARAVTDLIGITNSYYGYRLPMVFGRFLLDAYSVLPPFMFSLYPFFDFILGLYTFIISNTLTICMHFNRFTAVAYPIRHRKIWRTLLPISLLTIFTLPLAFCWRVFEMEPKLLVTGNGTLFYVGQVGTPKDGEISAQVNLVRIGSALSILLASILLNVGTLLAYRSRMAPSSTAMANESAMERKLLLYAFLTLLGHVFIAALMVGMYFGDLADPESPFLTVAAIQLPWVMDTGTVVLSSWLLLWASDSFRQQFLTDFWPKRFFKSSSSAAAGHHGNASTTCTRSPVIQISVQPKNTVIVGASGSN